MKKRKKILFFYMQGGKAGGSDTCLYLLIKYLDKTKYEPFLLYKDRSNFVDELAQNQVNLISVPIKDRKKKQTIIKENNVIPTKSNPSEARIVLSSIKHLLKRIPDIINLAKVISKYQIDIVHANHYLTGDRAMILASIIMGRKTISHNRGLYSPDKIDKIISSKIDLIVCMSDFSKKVYVDKGILDIKCKTIYDGIDPDLFRPSINTNDEIIIGCFGRLEKWKGQKVLIDAAEILVKTNSKIKFMLVGNGPDEEELKMLVKNKNLGEFFEFTGHTTKVKEYMNKSTIIVHTSVEPEPFGMVIIEAMALEKPVIATKIGGPLEIIDDGVDGYLIHPEKPELLAEKINYLINNKKIMNEISINARIKVKNKFHVKDYARQMENAYEQIDKNL